jgi:hypothetical protein
MIGLGFADVTSSFCKTQRVQETLFSNAMLGVHLGARVENQFRPVMVLV